MEWWGNKEEDEDERIQFCNRFHGSDWTLPHPGVTKAESSHLDIFMADMCRNLKLKYQSQVNYKGILGLSFVVPSTEFQDSRQNPENQCYCIQPGSDGENCPKDGMYQINTCSKGVQCIYFAFLSKTYLLE
jgi:hypothetical protein